MLVCNSPMSDQWRNNCSRPIEAQFSFVTDAGDVIVWEHLGMLNRDDYERGSGNGNVRGTKAMV